MFSTWTGRRALYIARNSRSISTGTRFVPAKTFDGAVPDPGSLALKEPTVFRQQFTHLPAIKKWFTPVDGPPDQGSHYNPDLSYLGRHGSLMVPLELTRYERLQGPSRPSDMRRSSFERIQAPLSLLLAHISSKDPSHQLYLAQCSLDDLPSELQQDLPVPELVSRIGRGDVYASSLWMGRPPTDTPLHRDPNPNLFVQLVGQKVIRLMTPMHGRRLYERLTYSGHANMRGEEMMVGDETNRLQEAVWKGQEFDGMCAKGVEARLESGDGLFIPLGWWHAVQSSGYGAHANASANWWFR